MLSIFKWKPLHLEIEQQRGPTLKNSLSGSNNSNALYLVSNCSRLNELNDVQISNSYVERYLLSEFKCGTTYWNQESKYSSLLN